MKALILSLEKGKAIVLLRGGEMRTVRARRDWSVGQEIDLHEAAAVWKPSVGSAAHIFVPMAACAAVLVLLFAGIYRLGGENIDRTLQPLSSGSMAQETQTAPDTTPLPTEIPAVKTPEPTAIPAMPNTQDGFVPQPSSKYCDECGQRGHDDDDCPNQTCDECGRRGHDDDDCPYEDEDDDDD